MTILFMLLTAVTPHVKAHKLPAITITAQFECARGEKFDLKNPFNSRIEWLCITGK